MVGPVDFQKNMDFWSQDKWTGCFPVKWHIIKNIPNATLQPILLQNNEHKPVTFSRDTQEIHYGPGTCMLKIFKYTSANDCLLDHFTMYEEEERDRKYKRSDLRRDAPRFIPVPKLYAAHVYVPRQPKADIALVDRIIRETHNMAGKLQDVNLDMPQGSWKESGNLVLDSGRRLKSPQLKQSTCRLLPTPHHKHLKIIQLKSRVPWCTVHQQLQRRFMKKRRSLQSTVLQQLVLR